MLLMRQKLVTEGKPGVWLSTKEMIDTMAWEDIVKQQEKTAKLAIR